MTRREAYDLIEQMLEGYECGTNEVGHTAFETMQMVEALLVYHMDIREGGVEPTAHDFLEISGRRLDAEDARREEFWGDVVVTVE